MYLARECTWIERLPSLLCNKLRCRDDSWSLSRSIIHSGKLLENWFAQVGKYHLRLYTANSAPNLIPRWAPRGVCHEPLWPWWVLIIDNVCCLSWPLTIYWVSTVIADLHNARLLAYLSTQRANSCRKRGSLLTRTRPHQWLYSIHSVLTCKIHNSYQASMLNVCYFFAVLKGKVALKRLFNFNNCCVMLLISISLPVEPCLEQSVWVLFTTPSHWIIPSRLIHYIGSMLYFWSS